MSYLGIDGSLGSNWKISLVVTFYGNKFVWEVVVACNLSINLVCPIIYSDNQASGIGLQVFWLMYPKYRKLWPPWKFLIANSFTIFIKTIEKSYNGHCKLFLPLIASQNIRKYNKCHMWTDLNLHHTMGCLHQNKQENFLTPHL